MRFLGWITMGLFLSHPAKGSDVTSVEPKPLLASAREAISHFLPDAYLVSVDGKLADASCGANSTAMNWKFVFQTDAPDLYGGHPVAGYVEYDWQPGASGCLRAQRVVVDTALAPILGYYYLSLQHDLDRVSVDWQQALATATKAAPGFAWSHELEIFTPLYPGAEASVYYVFLGSLDGKLKKVYVDTTTGQIVPGT